MDPDLVLPALIISGYATVRFYRIIACNNLFFPLQNEKELLLTIVAGGYSLSFLYHNPFHALLPTKYFLRNKEKKNIHLFHGNTLLHDKLDNSRNRRQYVNYLRYVLKVHTLTLTVGRDL